MTRSPRRYVLDTQLFINAFRDPIVNERLQLFHRAFSPFEHLSVIVAQAGAARRVFTAKPQTAAAALGSIEAVGRDALDGLRRLVTLLL